MKNREGNDSPDTSRAALVAIAREWLEAAGQTVAADAIVEISPLAALSADDLTRQSDDELTGEVFIGG